MLIRERRPAAGEEPLKLQRGTKSPARVKGSVAGTTDPTKLGLSLSLSLPPIAGRARQSTLTSTADLVKI